MTVYTCNSCLYIFKQKSKPQTCPDCGKPEVRTAVLSEQEEYKKRKFSTCYMRYNMNG